MRFSFALFFIFASFSATATQWLKFDEKTFLIAPPTNARYLTSNQAILIGQRCAAIIDAHGDFSALENFASEVKKRIPQPICHLFSTSSDEEQILGMMLLATEFPDATWHAPSYVSEHFNEYQNALEEKLSRFKQSLQLSQSRIDTQPNVELQQRLDKAKARIDKWQNAQFSRPIAPSHTQIDVELGEHLITINTFQGATHSDLSVLSHYNLGLFAGLTANPIPYAQGADASVWLYVLEQLQATKITWILPSQGKPFKKSALQKPIRFLKSVIENESTEAPVDLLQLYNNDEITQTRLRLMYELAKAKQAQKMQKH